MISCTVDSSWRGLLKIAAGAGRKQLACHPFPSIVVIVFGVYYLRPPTPLFLPCGVLSCRRGFILYLTVVLLTALRIIGDQTMVDFSLKLTEATGC